MKVEHSHHIFKKHSNINLYVNPFSRMNLFHTNRHTYRQIHKHTWRSQNSLIAIRRTRIKKLMSSIVTKTKNFQSLKLWLEYGAVLCAERYVTLGRNIPRMDRDVRKNSCEVAREGTKHMITSPVKDITVSCCLYLKPLIYMILDCE